jgi:hypothetical protein
MPAASLAAENANFIGHWENADGYASWTITSENFATGECVGTSIPGYVLTGCKVTGQAYEFVIETDGGEYKAFNKGTIEGNKATGSFNDGTEHQYTATRLLNLTGTWSAVYECEVGCKGSVRTVDTLSQAEGSSSVTGANETESISGTVSGQTFEYHSSVGANTSEGTLTVSEDGLSWSGTLRGSPETSGRYKATRLPSVSSVSPSSGSTLGGTAVAITGGGFSGGASVSFGSSPASSVTVSSTGSITATSPAGAGTVDVTVTTSSGTSATTPGDRFTYVAPATTAIVPATPLPEVAFTPVPAPQLGVTGNVAPVSGIVLVRVPPSTTFVPLASLRQIPFGSVIEATQGRVSVTTAAPHGGTQTGEFFAGEFVLTQGRNGLVVATLTGGSFAVCPTARERAHKARASAAAASGKHVVRKLWADAHGSFSTKGNYAAGAVAGTEWLTEDLCDGTLIRVTRDKVAVTNLVTHRHVMVTVGHPYLAKAP